MAGSEPRRLGLSVELKPHAYDPAVHPELFAGVLARRCLAFLIDLAIIAVPIVLAGVFMLLTTIATLGLAGLLYAFLSPLFWPLIVIWAICYYGFSFGSPASATIGMRVMDLEMRTWYGAPAYFLLGAVHAVAFWLTISYLTPLILLVPFFNHRRRLLNDVLVGSIVINSQPRAEALRRAYMGG
ncbi:MAG: RDD family protein [Xanthobacteraceae bacterium]